MPGQCEIVPLSWPGAGTERRLLRLRYGRPVAETGGKKAYIQASIHADETPAMLTAYHLRRLLDAAEDAGQIEGEIVLMPYANPIGIAQFVNGNQLGRHAIIGDGNFNRNWPDLAAMAAEAVGPALTDDPATNVALIRKAMVAAIDALEPLKEIDHLRVALTREACTADLVLDMHCDNEALMHLFIAPQHWPSFADLAADIGARAVMTAEDSGGSSFDECNSGPWLRLAERFPDKPIPPVCEATTVELRGWADVFDELAEADAAGIFRTLQRRGYIAGDPGPLPELLCEATELRATDSLRSPKAGIIRYRVDLGAQVKTGDLIAEVMDPGAVDLATANTPIHARNDGFILSRRLDKYVYAGGTVAKVVGKEPLPHRQGFLLED